MIYMEQELLDGRVLVKVGDLTKEDVDAIVNAANSGLMGGGGVDGAIHRAGGRAILDECKRIRETDWPEGLPTGRAVITTGGDLKARHVIHTVGPVWSGRPGKDEQLASCYTESLRLAADQGLRTIAFPAISTGIYHFPKDRAARVASAAVKAFLEENDSIEQVRFVFFSEGDARTFLENSGF